MITLRNKIGQMLIMGFSGCEINDHSPVAKWLSGDGLGGVLLFDKDLATGQHGKNLKNQTQIKYLIHQLNHYAANFTLDNVPLLISIDYEGGAVDRLAGVKGCMPTLTAVEMSQLSTEALEEELCQMASTLKYLGFNVNFAPVVDLQITPQQGIIGALQRSFSDNPQEVIRIARHFVSVFARYGIACAYKHFPGHGAASGDTHTDRVEVTNSFSLAELEPFRRLLDDVYKPIMVMTAHVVNKQLDEQGLPATLSHTIITGLLRQSMGFDGVVISDDLQMQAIAKHYSLEEALCLTINAGADMMIFANQLGNHTAHQIIDTVEQLVMQERINPRRIDDAYRRIIRLKKCMDVMQSEPYL